MNSRRVLRVLVAIPPVILAGLSIESALAASLAPAFASASSAAGASGAPSMLVADLARALAWPLTALPADAGTGHSMAGLTMLSS